MTLVVDSSVVVAALIDHGPVGEWADALLVSGPLTAPHLMPAEVANILRRSAMAGDVTADIASLAHEDSDCSDSSYSTTACAHRGYGNCGRT